MTSGQLIALLESNHETVLVTGQAISIFGGAQMPLRYLLRGEKMVLVEAHDEELTEEYVQSICRRLGVDRTNLRTGEEWSRNRPE